MRGAGGFDLTSRLLEIASARTSQLGQQSKADQVYSYLTSSRFKQRIEALVERFGDMRDDINKERKFMMKAWAKREAQVSAMIEATVGMVGDLHGIMERAMPEIAAIDQSPMIEGESRFEVSFCRELQLIRFYAEPYQQPN